MRSEGAQFTHDVDKPRTWEDEKWEQGVHMVTPDTDLGDGHFAQTNGGRVDGEFPAKAFNNFGCTDLYVLQELHPEKFAFLDVAPFPVRQQDGRFADRQYGQHNPPPSPSAQARDAGSTHAQGRRDDVGRQGENSRRNGHVRRHHDRDDRSHSDSRNRNRRHYDDHKDSQRRSRDRRRW